MPKSNSTGVIRADESYTVAEFKRKTGTKTIFQMILQRYSLVTLSLAMAVMGVTLWCLIISNTSETQSSATYHGEFNKPKEPRPIVPELKIGERALEFQLPTAKNGTIQLAEFKGQKLVVAFLSSFD